MPDRSISALPSFYGATSPDALDDLSYQPGPLEILDITYLHFHSLLELGVCTSGQGCCIVEGREFPFSAGDVQIIFPFQSHLSRSEGGEYSRWIWRSINPMQLLSQWGAPDLPRLERMLYTGMGLYGIIDRNRYPLIASLIERITMPGKQVLRLSCLCTLVEELAAQSKGLPALELRPEIAFTRLEPALNLAQDELESGRIPVVTALANACAMSLATFRRAFHQVMGQSPQQYIQNCQMKKAQRMLLLSDASVTEIAFSVGYQDVSGFNRLFLRYFGVSPRQYRASVFEMEDIV